MSCYCSSTTETTGFIMRNINIFYETVLLAIPVFFFQCFNAPFARNFVFFLCPEHLEIIFTTQGLAMWIYFKVYPSITLHFIFPPVVWREDRIRTCTKGHNGLKPSSWSHGIGNNGSVYMRTSPFWNLNLRLPMASLPLSFSAFVSTLLPPRLIPRLANSATLAHHVIFAIFFALFQPLKRFSTASPFMPTKPYNFLRARGLPLIRRLAFLAETGVARATDSGTFFLGHNQT